MLSENGIRSGQIVGIMTERSPDMLIGILGILKAGGAYLPIDPDYPDERISFMLTDSGARVLLTQSGLGISGMDGSRFYTSISLNPFQQTERKK